METITLTFSTSNPFAANIDAFLKTVPSSVKVSKRMKTQDEKVAKKERFLAKLTKAGQQGLDIAAKNPKGYTAEELIALL